MGHIILAHATMTKIDAMIQADQGASYRGWLGKVIGHITDAYRTDEDGHRNHMGASLIGGECPRAIWFNFHWATKSNFGGRILRLFNRGHLEEARFIALLLMIGCDVYQQDADGKQYRVSHAEGHFGGSGDGVALHCPDLPAGTPAVTEFKTHGEKSFIELAGKLEDWRKHLADPTRHPFTGKGVREAKFEHYVQMNVYMRKMGLPAALYMAVNKNTDDIYAEVLPLDATIADQFLDRGDKLVWMKDAPEKISSSSGFFKCRFCDHRPVCHLGAVPDRNCRTCVCSEPVEGGKWACNNEHRRTELLFPESNPLSEDFFLTKERQLKGCERYTLRAEFVK